MIFNGMAYLFFLIFNLVGVSFASKVNADALPRYLDPYIDPIHEKDVQKPEKPTQSKMEKDIFPQDQDSSVEGERDSSLKNRLRFVAFHFGGVHMFNPTNSNHFIGDVEFGRRQSFDLGVRLGWRSQSEHRWSFGLLAHVLLNSLQLGANGGVTSEGVPMLGATLRLWDRISRPWSQWLFGVVSEVHFDDVNHYYVGAQLGVEWQW